MKKRALTGITPTGTIHIGNYFGAIAPALSYQDQYECFFFVADFHALTTNKNREEIISQTYDIVAAWLAFGFNPKRHFMYRQSDVPLTAELAWYLSCVTGVGLLQKGHAYKDALAKNKEVNHGVLAYPVLMAADILLYEADIVPVGKDQKQHVEFTRDMAGSFNAVYGEGILKLPTPLIREEVMAVPGLDGRKMSKSYNNVIPLFEKPEKLKKLVMSIKTDSTPLEEPKDLDSTIIGAIYK
ncbi:MAG: tryptophan--tRNA ligase, partial [Candidatus Dadabacteria bacterium]